MSFFQIKFLVVKFPPLMMADDVVVNRLEVGSPLETRIGDEKAGITVGLPGSEICRRTAIGWLVAGLVEVEVEGVDGAGVQGEHGVDKAVLLVGSLVGAVQIKDFLAMAEGEDFVDGR